MGEQVTRLAPSPTGALHLGNARTFAINWALARRRGWKIVLRVEDLDGPRIKSGTDTHAIDILSWLGLDWDDGPHYQLNDLSTYHHALSNLGDAGLIYRCNCSRKEIATAQSAPHADDSHDPRYPGTHRPATPQPIRYEPDNSAWRFRTDDDAVTFTDQFAGPQSINVNQTVGDFIVATKAGLPAYQLAVVVDDARQGITHIVRGDDLLTSTPRQLLLYRALGLSPEPMYFHVPLVIGEDGKRLAKRHGDTRLARYRELGVGAQRIMGLIGYWCGLPQRRPMPAQQFRDGFDFDRLPRRPITFTAADEAWLMEQSS